MTSFECSIPQGSILEPLLFLIYVNDFPQISSDKAIMFADDTNIFIKEKDYTKLKTGMDLG